MCGGNMKRIAFVLLSLLLAAVVLAGPVGASEYNNSFVHISDTQNMAQWYPDILNLTYQEIEALKTSKNITFIIHTGDITNGIIIDGEWKNDTLAMSHTTIPRYAIAGNHDIYISSHWNNSIYRSHEGNDRVNYTAETEDFILSGISAVQPDHGTNDQDISNMSAAIAASSKMPIIFTHNYTWYTTKTSYSLVAEQIQTSLVQRPSIILSGHDDGDYLNYAEYNGHRVFEDRIDYQSEGTPYGKYGVFRLYTVTHKNGNISKITTQLYEVYPASRTNASVVAYNELPPISSFTALPLSGDLPLAVSFTDTTTRDPITWNWSLFSGSVTNLLQINQANGGGKSQDWGIFLSV